MATYLYFSEGMHLRAAQRCAQAGEIARRRVATERQRPPCGAKFPIMTTRHSWREHALELSASEKRGE